MKKLLVLLFLFLIIFFLFSGGKKAYLKAKSSIRGIQEERIMEEDIKFALVEEEEKNYPVEGVYIPYHWKSGIMGEGKDYLKGYIPSIKDFVDYVQVRDSVIYGSSVTTPTIANSQLAISLLEDSEVVLADGIKNAHTYFNWDKEKCSIVGNTHLNEKIFVCDNWVNWMKSNNPKPLFVLTDCNIENQHGKCLFLDYTNIYFNMKKMTENRCLSSNRSKLCDLDEYIKLIKYK